MRLEMILLVLCSCASAPVLSGATSWKRSEATEHPRPAADDAVISHTVEFDVAKPRDAFVPDFLAGGLEKFLPGTSELPGVDHTEQLSRDPYPAIGSLRLVCLKDGQTAEEEVLEQDLSHLRYLVTRYTSESAKPVEYGLGEFTFTPVGAAGATTHVRWQYSFKLRGDRFPGSWGGVGRSLFRWRFLDSTYADFMESGAAAIQRYAVRAP